MRQLTYEFVLRTGVHLADPDPWDSLAVTRSGIRMRIQKPIANQNLIQIPETIGNAGVELRYTVMRVEAEVEDSDPDPDWRVPFAVVTECLNWIRVFGRQYLVGTLRTGTNSVVHGTLISGSGNHTGFGAFQSPISVKPLSKELWSQIGEELTNCNVPTIPDLTCLPTGSSNNSSWSRVIEEMAGGQHRADEPRRAEQVRGDTDEQKRRERTQFLRRRRSLRKLNDKQRKKR